MCADLAVGWYIENVEHHGGVRTGHLTVQDRGGPLQVATVAATGGGLGWVGGVVFYTRHS